MPINSTRGAGSAKGFGLTSGIKTFEVDYLVVAGGGGGCLSGGGAGGYRASAYGPSPLNSGTKIKITKTTPVTVGGGGTSSFGNPTCGGRGSPSIFGTIVSTGGGGGNLFSAGGPGGSGGGADTAPIVGIGNTPPFSPPQGNNGGYGIPINCSNFLGGGGGGAGAPGGNATPSVTGVGGAGVANSITGSPVNYAGGGGGGAQPPASYSRSPGGIGGGGNGGTGNPGACNTGGGAGGNNYYTPQATGGPGVVIVRAPSAVTFSVSPGTNTTSTTPGGCKVARFTVSGVLTTS
jgi:hypothetical protein